MMNHDWERQRSIFNHGWLKNRLVACLLRCKRVASGLVQDDNAKSDLFDLLIGWEAVRPSAVQVLLEMESRVHNSLDPLSSDSLALGEPTCRYLLEVDRLRWLQLTNAEKLGKDASKALEDIDDVTRRTRTRLQDSGTMPDAEMLRDLEERARRLGGLFSSLTLCQDSILSADEYI
jgi:hypothetical protein